MHIKLCHFKLLFNILISLLSLIDLLLAMFSEVTAVQNKYEMKN